jgi:coproporphyrinogen III oxidase-like Fe-S oxidoreductase
LIAAGVDGFSLYELMIYPQNRKWAERHDLIERDHLANYFAFQAGAAWLAARGFGKNLFNHWANRRDTNIYFTFPTRGEDCLAVGTIADGVFGDYHYRHPRYAAYTRLTEAGGPGLEGGLRRNAFENRLQPITTAILSDHIPAHLCPTLRAPEGEPLGEHWQAHGLVEADSRDGLRLTASGAWFTGNLIAELAGQIPVAVHQRRALELSQ